MNYIWNSRIKKFNIVMLAILIGLFAYRLWLTDKISTGGDEYLNKYNTLMSLKKENEELSNKYYTITSIANIKERAEKLGYVNRNVSYLKNDKLASSDVSQ